MNIVDLLARGDSALPAATGGFVMGRVAENGSSDFPGMVKVSFTAWTRGSDVSEWMPVLSCYAGKEHGRYIVPEVDDIVLVGFIGPMLEQPFVLGSFFPADSSIPGEQNDDNNTNKTLKTKSGIIVSIHEKSVGIETPKGLAVLLDDESEAITVSDKDAKNKLMLDCKGGAVELLADKSITIKAGQCELSFDGSGGAVTIKGGAVTVEGSQSLDLKSNSMLTASGGTATFEGKQTAKLSGSAMCEISGGMVKIN